MNILILSPGRRVEIVKYFKETFHSVGKKVYTLDMSPYAPALYFGDEYFCIEKDFDNLKTYVYSIINICKVKKISAVITLIDPELVLLSEYKVQFKKEGITPILCDLNFINNTFDKYKFYSTYKDSIKLVDTVNSFSDVLLKIKNREWHYPLFAKLKSGSASIGIKKISSIYDFNDVKNNEGYIFQPYIEGTEYGVDAYFDMINGKLISFFIKKKIAMRAGETDKAISVKSDKIFNEIVKLEKLGGIYGPIDIDVFVEKSGEVYINEINPRFGGGHPHAYCCGVNFMKLILNNLEGKENIPNFNNYKDGVIMLKYNGLYFLNSENDRFSQICDKL